MALRRFGMKKVFLSALFLLFCSVAHATDKYWVGGPGTWDTTTTTHWSLSNGGANGAAAPTASDNVFFTSLSGGGTVTIGNASDACLNMDATGFTGLFAGSSALAVSGSWKYDTTNGTPTYTGTITFNATTSQTITSNGKTFLGSITLNGVAGVWTLQDNFIMTNTKTLTLTNGDFEANGKTVQVGLFSSSNANTRTITMGSGQWTITGNAGTVWTTATTTGLTFNNGSNPIQFNYSGATGTRTISTGSLGVSNAPSVSITAGTDTVAVSTQIVNLNFTGFSGVLSNSARTIYGNLTFSSGMTFTGGASTTTFAATSGTQQITSNGNTNAADFPFTFNGVGGTFQLQDNLTAGSTRLVTLTNGTLDANNHNFSMGQFSSSNSNIRTITMGSGTWTLAGTGTVWTTATATNLTLNYNTSTIAITDTSASSKTFASSNSVQINIYNFSVPSGTAGVSGALLFTGNAGIFFNGNFGVGAGDTLTWRSSISYSFAGNFSATGVSGNITTFNASTPGTPATLGGGSVTYPRYFCDYLSLTDIVATGSAGWYAGDHSTAPSDVNGWVFTSSKDRYWVGGSATWNSSSSNWSFTDGGSSGAPAPTGTEDVHFTAASGGVTVTLQNNIVYSGSTDFTGFTGILTGGGASSSLLNGYNSLTALSWAGDAFFKLSASMSVTTGAGFSEIALYGNTCELTTAGVVIPSSTALFTQGGTVTLQDDLNMGTGTIELFGNGFNTNNHNIIAGTFVQQSGTCNMGSSSMTLSNTGIPFDLSTGTFNAGTSTVTLSGSSPEFETAGNKGLYNFVFSGSGTLSFVTGSITFNSFTDSSPGTTISFTPGSTYTSNSFNATGTSGHLITLTSGNTSTYSLVKSGGGVVSCDYLSVQHSVATPGSTWYAGTHSTNNQGVATAGSGWIFTAPPAPTNQGNFLALLNE